MFNNSMLHHEKLLPFLPASFLCESLIIFSSKKIHSLKTQVKQLFHCYHSLVVVAVDVFVVTIFVDDEEEEKEEEFYLMLPPNKLIDIFLNKRRIKTVV